MNLKLRHIWALIAIACCSAAYAASNVTLKATLDSAYILMGKQTDIHLEIVQGKHDTGILLNNSADTISKNVEIINKKGAKAADTVDLGNDRVQILRNITIQSFDSGLYTIPPFVYAVGKDTFKSNELALKVLPVPVDTLKTINDYAGVTDPDTRFYDYLPDFITDYWWLYVILLVIAIGLLVYFKFIKKGKVPLLPKKKEIPPYDLAIMALNHLKDSHLCERGQEKEYYTRLTGILREYLDKRFGINAMEMTSTQIVHALNHNVETKEPNKFMKQILEIADFVKFAKVRPLPEDNTKAFQWAMQFVEDTKPAPIPASTDATGTMGTTAQGNQPDSANNVNTENKK